MIDLKGGVKFGEYTLLEYKGEGTTSQVWSAKNNESERIALKIFAPKTSLDNLSKGLLREEFEKTKELKSDYLLVPTSYFEYQEVPALAMPLCDGSMWQELINRLKNNTKKPEEELGVLFQESTIGRLINNISIALKFLHDKRLVHNDVKPANILFQNLNDKSKCRFFLTDFGITKETRDTILRQTKTQNSLTFAYASPEVLKGERGTYKSDIFSLGTSIYELINGTDLDVPLGQILNNNGQVPQLNSKYSNRLINLLHLCLEKDPESRISIEKLVEHSEFFLKNNYWPDTLENRNDNPTLDNDSRDTIMNYIAPENDINEAAISEFSNGFSHLANEPDVYENEELERRPKMMYFLLPLILVLTYFGYNHLNQDSLVESNNFLSSYDNYLQPVLGLQCVYKNNKCGVVDLNGNIVKPIEYTICINRPNGIELKDQNQKSIIVN